jgi:hypothetical protein
MSRRHPLRLLGLCLVGALAISACGASESSDGDRDRNIDIGADGQLFARALDGVARNKIADMKLSLPVSSSARAQTDGSTLIAVTSLGADKDGMNSEIAVVRVDPTGQIDETFGSSGVRTLKLKRPLAMTASLSDDGHVLVPGVEIDSLSNEGLPVTGVTRFDLATGQRDENFGPGGSIEIAPTGISSESFMVDGGDGVFLLGTSTEISTDGRYLMRWTKDGRDTNFGSGGMVAVPNPEYAVELNQRLECEEPTLWPDANNTLTVIFGCILFSYGSGEQSSEVVGARRVFATRQFNRDGEVIGGADRFAFIDETSDLVIGWDKPEVLGFAIGFGADADSRYLTVDTVPGPRVIRLIDNYGTIADSGLPQNGALPELAIGTGLVDTTSLTYTQYVHGLKPFLAGLTMSTLTSSLDMVVGPFPNDGFFNNGNTVRVGDYPFVAHGIENLSYVGNDVFMNIASVAGVEYLSFGDRLPGGDGYLKIGRDGVTREPYGSVDGMADSPLNEGFGVDKNLIIQPGLFPALDGSLTALAVEMALMNPGDVYPASTFHVQRYDATGEKSGEPISLSVDNFNTIFGQNKVTAGFDGNDNFFVAGFRGVDFGVVKLSISDKSIDESFGVDGFAAVPLNEFGAVDPWWFESVVQVSPTGSIDLISSNWSFVPNEFDQFPLQIASLRFTPSGQIDEKAPPVKFDLDNVVSCGCFFDGWLATISRATTVDSEGRLLLSFPRLRWEGADGELGGFVPAAVRTPIEGDDAARFLGGGDVRRFLRNGEFDMTFGVGGTGGVDLYQMGIPFPLGAPRIALDAEDNIFLTVNALEMRLTGLDGKSNIDFVLDGEYSYALMLDSSGNPLNFTPRDPLPVSMPIIEELREARADLGLGEPVEAPIPTIGDAPADTPVAPLVAPPGASAESVIPAEVVQINAGETPVISVVGTPADRTIDVRWSVPASLAGGKATYTVSATPGGQKCTTTTTSCVFKKLEPWNSYTFTITTVRAASTAVADSAPSVPIKPVRIVKRKSRTAATKLITPASKGRAAWKATGGCTVSKDGKTFSATKDAATCTLSVTTAKSGKTPKTTRTITVVVRAVAS